MSMYVVPVMGLMYVCIDGVNSDKYINVLETASIPLLSQLFGAINHDCVKFSKTTPRGLISSNNDVV